MNEIKNESINNININIQEIIKNSYNEKDILESTFPYRLDYDRSFDAHEKEYVFNK